MRRDPRPARQPISLRSLGLIFGLGIALLANWGDRAFSASAANNGIDPLQILDTGVNNNVLFMISNAGTLSGTIENDAAAIGGDDPASRLYQIKQAVREVITNNVGRANFGLATFQPDFTEHKIDDTTGLMYVTQDPTAAAFVNNFTTLAASAGVSIRIGASSGATGNRSTFSAPDWTPTADTLLVTFVLSTNTAIDPTGVTGHGLTYSKLAVGVAPLAVGGADSAMSVWVAKAGASPTSVGPVATFSSSVRGVMIFEYQVSGADITGTNASDAIAQSVTSSGTGTTAATTLAAASNAANAVMYFVGHAENESTTEQTGWTEPTSPASDYSYQAAGNNQVGGEVQFNTTFSTSARATWSTSSPWRGIAIEIKAAPPPTIIDSCAGTPCTAAESSGLFSQLTSNDNGTSAAYPAGCTAQSSNQVAVGGTVNAPITHVFGTHCRYYLRSKLMLNGKRYSVSRGAASTAAVLASANITCPSPPPGLLGDSILDASDGSLPRACFQLQDVTPTATLRITTYWLTGTRFKYVTSSTPPVTTPSNACNETGLNVAVSDCGGTGSETAIKNLMNLELEYGTSTGIPAGVPALTSLTGLAAPAYGNAGIRVGTSTPIAKALAWALDYFRTNILPAAGTGKRPVAAQGKQKQFVVLIIDKEDNCSTLAEAKTAAYNLWSNTLPSLGTCTGACLANKGVTAAQWAAANRIELIVVPFAGGSQANLDEIAQAGSGKNPSTGICDPDGVCRSAPIAGNLTQLKKALTAAIFGSSASGEFSDQQSVTETVFEFASLTTPARDPLNPGERYASSIPILMQSTFEMPGFLGHLKAFRRGNAGTVSDVSDDVAIEEWDAGKKLYDRVANSTTGMGTAAYTFTALYGDATPSTVKTSTAKIKRRIYSTTQNGVNPSFTATNLLGASVSSLAWTRVPLWPPSTSASTDTSVAPTVTFASGTPIKGILDTAMGFDAWTTVAQVQAAVPGACQGSVTANIHPDCTSLTAGLPLARAKREAREIVLAFIAGARVRSSFGLPVRIASGPDAGRLQYEVRPWILAESTLAAPGVVTPPLLEGPSAGSLGADEYVHYRDGVRTSAGVPIDGNANGLGLRNPDRLAASASTAAKDAAAANLNLKPSMSVVYHATNQGLHAFRAGPCPIPRAGSSISTVTIPCAGEGGGEELWAFVPYDLLGKLPPLVTTQTRSTKQYLLASPVRFADIFVPGSATFNGVTFTGVWRTILFFGRGAGGKYYTAIDITTPGPFTRHSLTTSEPIVVWNRGNPDTTKGLPCASGTHNNSLTTADCPTYAKLGETWSVPAVGFVTKADYTTSRTSAGANFVLFTGSGFSDVSGEGRTFFILDALNGDIVRSFDIANGSPAAPETTLTNFLVSSPVGYTEESDGTSPSGFNFLGNPVSAKTKTVYFPDLHSRIWRYNATTPATAPVAFFTASAATVGNQPFGTALSILQNPPAPAASPSSTPEVLVFGETGYDQRVAPQATKPFKAYAFKDVAGSKTDLFSFDFGTGYRGTVQPATAFAGAGTSPAPVVFYAAVKFNPACVATFDSFLFAFKGVPSVANTPEAAFDLSLPLSDDDIGISLVGKKINAIRVSGEGTLVIDQGLSANLTPPPPGVAVPSVPIPGSSAQVHVGLSPLTQAFKDLASTTAPYRIGSSVCRTVY